MNRTSARQAAPKRIRKTASLDKKKASSGWVFVLPFILGLIFIYGPIVFDSIKYSFHSIKPLQGGGFRLVWVGFSNYEYALFTDPDFVGTLISGIKELLIDIPAIIIFSLFVAIMLNQKMVGRAFFRAVLFVPVVLSTGILDTHNELIDQMANNQTSIDTGANEDAVKQIVSVTDLDWLFANMQIGSEIVVYVTNLVNNILDVINRSGVQMLVFLAGLQSISPAIYESCEIDGATSWETFWKITVPMISPMILVNTVYTVIDAFTAADNRVMSFISDIYNTVGGNVISAAMSWIYFLVVAIIIGLVIGVLSIFIFYQRRQD